VQAIDMLEAMQKKGAHEQFVDEFTTLLESVGTPAAEMALKTIQGTLSDLARMGADEAQWHSKRALVRFADAAQVGLLYDLADTGGDRYAKLAELYAAHFIEGDEYPAWAMKDASV